MTAAVHNQPGTSVELADGLESDRKTIRMWRNRFTEKRCDGVIDEPRPCRPTVVSDDQMEALITATSWLAGKGVPTGRFWSYRRGRVGD
jgi:transposase